MHRHREFETAIDRLNALPDETKAEMGPKINQYLNKLEDLKAAIQEGLDSGDAGPLDVEEIIREARAEKAAAR